MARALTALLLVPLVWPWMFGMATDAAAALLAHGALRDWPWWSWEQTLLNSHFFRWAYLLMLLVFLPCVLLFRKLGLNAMWVYVTSGAILGLIGPIAFSLALDIIRSPKQWFEMLAGPGRLDWEALLMMFGHMLSGSAIASAVMMVIFWFAAVKGNPFFGMPPNSALNRTRKNGAPVS